MKFALDRRNRLLAGLVVVAFLMSGMLTISTVNAQVTCSPFHVVQPGENLFRVGLRYGVQWTVLQQLNGIVDPNRIIVGQIICLPGSSPVITTPVVTIPPAPSPTPTYGTGGPIVFFPPPNVFPSIDFNMRAAGPGNTITITGINFPGNEMVDIFITPTGSPYPTTPSGSAATAFNGTLNTAFTIPAQVDGVALRGPFLSVMARGRVSGYFGYNFFRNTRP